MPAPFQRDLADALERAHKAAPKGVVRSADLSRKDRELLQRAGYLQDIVKGWYFLVRPGLPAGESTAWYASFWSFLATYLDERFGQAYCLSAVSSLELQVGVTTVPSQVVVITAHGGKTLLNLPHQTSVLVYQDARGLPAEVEVLEGLRVMPPAQALARLLPAYFTSHPINVEVGLRSLADAGSLIRIILDQRSPTLAGRFAGAYAHVGDEARARAIESSAQAVGLAVRRRNPFDRAVPVLPAVVRVKSPVAGRIQALFQSLREPVLEVFRSVKPSQVRSDEACLHRIDGVYVHDAYNSLSIEGYQVTPELIRRIRAGHWNPDGVPQDRQARDALAAKGYLEAFTVVRGAVGEILKGREAAAVARDRYQEWYQALFSESVRAGVLEAHRLAGHRNGPVYIRNSKHVPPRATSVTDAMEALFDSLHAEQEPVVQAVLGHFFFGFIHPYFDGNGRLARFLMNVFLAPAGYRWTIIRTERRAAYLDALEQASTQNDIVAFARLVRDEMQVDWSKARNRP